MVVALARDSDPEVRAWAVSEIGAIGWNRPAARDLALPHLKKYVSDTGEVDGDKPKVTVGELAAYRIRQLESGEFNPDKPKPKPPEKKPVVGFEPD